MYDICIVGGGASGMAAAITAKEKNTKLSIIILEKKESLGKKILATGNGKCNICNEKCEKSDMTINFFNNLGVLIKIDETGRMYPYNEDAKSVLEGLETRINVLGIKVVTDFEVSNIKDVVVDDETAFHIDNGKKKVIAKKVLLSTGGKAGPEFGSTGDGYKLAKAYGHHVTKLAPILTGIEANLKEQHVKINEFAGIRAKATVSLYYCEKLLFKESGEVQFTKDGLSGIVIFNMTRFIEAPDGIEFSKVIDNFTIKVSFYDDNNLNTILRERREIIGFNVIQMLNSLVRKPLAMGMLLNMGIDPYKQAKKVTERELELINDSLTGLTFSLKGLKGWKSAQATRGGIFLNEVKWTTMESNFRNNLYIAGELLDVDGPCGGYNLQNAWETGIKAGQAMSL